MATQALVYGRSDPRVLPPAVPGLLAQPMRPVQQVLALRLLPRQAAERLPEHPYLTLQVQAMDRLLLTTATG